MKTALKKLASFFKLAICVWRRQFIKLNSSPNFPAIR